MRMRKLLLIPVFFSLLVCGCGKQSTTTGTSNQEATTAEEIPSGDVTLTLWGAEEDGALLEQITSAFASEHSSEANISFNIVPMSESECKDQILGNINEAPDVFTFADDQVRALAAAGVLGQVENADVSSRNIAASVDAASINGNLYAYPLTADNGYFLYYNKAYFQESDLATLDGILAVAASNGKQVSMEVSSGWYMYSFFGNTGLELGLNDDGITNYCTWNSTENPITGVDVANAMLAIASNPGFVNGGDDVLKEGAANDTVIAGVSGVWLSTDLAEIWGDNLGAVKLPTYTVAGQQVQMASYAGYKLIGVNQHSANVYWANAFADYLSNEENQTLRFEMRGQGPSNSNAASSSAVAASPAIQAVIAQSEYAQLQRVGGAYWDPATAFSEAILSGSVGDLQELMDTLVAGITAKVTD